MCILLQTWRIILQFTQFTWRKQTQRWVAINATSSLITWLKVFSHIVGRPESQRRSRQWGNHLEGHASSCPRSFSTEAGDGEQRREALQLFLVDSLEFTLELFLLPIRGVLLSLTNTQTQSSSDTYTDPQLVINVHTTHSHTGSYHAILGSIKSNTKEFCTVSYVTSTCVVMTILCKLNSSSDFQSRRSTRKSVPFITIRQWVLGS